MDKIKQNCRWLYVLLFVVAVFPLFQMKSGIDFIYVGKIVLIQLLALEGSYLMFQTLTQNPLAVLLGVTLFVTAPYRIDLCYVQGDLVLSAVWAFVPLYIYGMMRVREKGIRGIGDIVFSAVVLAVLGYGSDIMFCVMLALTLLLAVVFKKVVMLLPAVVGGLIWLPGNTQFLLYLFTNQVNDLALPIKNITPEGYAISDFLTSYTYLEGKPGLGLGLLGALALYVYVRFVNGGARLNREGKLFGAVGALSLFLATRYFPWELVQRVGTWALKFVSLIDTPALFTGFAALLLPVVVLPAVEELEASEDRVPARGSLVIVWVMAVGIALYLSWSCHRTL